MFIRANNGDIYNQDKIERVYSICKNGFIDIVADMGSYDATLCSDIKSFKEAENIMDSLSRWIGYYNILFREGNIFKVDR